MKILGYISGFDGCGLFRLQLPFKYLNKKPNVVAKISFVYDKLDIEWADIVIVQKQYQDSVIPYVKMAQESGKKVVLEYDDLMSDIPAWNKASEFYGNKKDQVVNFIRLSDACTVTTDYLKQYHVLDNPNIHVLPNSMDIPQVDGFKSLALPDLYKYTTVKDPKSLKSEKQQNIPLRDALDKMKGRLKIMWWGSATHEEDLHIIDRTLAKLCKHHPEIIIVKIGCCTDAFLDYMEPYLDQLVIVNKALVHHFHQVLYSVASTGPSISVCPIVDIPFNRAKSNLKVIESWAVGAAVVVSNVENYAKTVTNGVDGLVASNDVEGGIADDWYEKLSFLITQPEERDALAKAGALTVRSHYNIEKNADMWLDVYDQVLRG